VRLRDEGASSASPVALHQETDPAAFSTFHSCSRGAPCLMARALIGTRLDRHWALGAPEHVLFFLGLFRVCDEPYAEQALKGCSDLMFLELLFWKNAREAESLRNNYQWQVRHISRHACLLDNTAVQGAAHEAGIATRGGPCPIGHMA